FTAKGLPSGSEFRVNTVTTANQNNQAVAGLADGGYVVAWTSNGQTGTFTLYAQRYDAKAKAVGAEFRVSAPGNGDFGPVTAAGLTDGGFVIGWETDDGDSGGILAQRFDASGKKAGKQFL